MCTLEQKKSVISRIAILLFIFGVFSLIYSYYLDLEDGASKTYELSLKDTLIGPLVSNSSSGIYSFLLKQHFEELGSGRIDADVLDANKQFLFGFGDNFWRDFVQEEFKFESELKATLPLTEEYFIRVKTSSQDTSSSYRASITIVSLKGSSVLNRVFGFILLGMAFIIRFVGVLALSNGLGKAIKTSVPLIFLVFVFLYILFS